ncbi:MAG: hypothetical protein ACD_51C00046G0014 [uncultured bacterium]|nr:MAG: hypothetical protein ACD_51C00046G0014 [uncultured bacterium]OGJ47298.1 MAG: hypothetical protein A2244_00435 [Candidatus Peregrinibacteria bacterium RIFOXYA2_FULL_41_18]OGJ48399.1 MAG: hypothetical protein A2344_05360 [Candidatus Peregrinibacteria bacterium RIFOXYB12_FULL_41_12]OGJ52573.1 MAG: hypothetical protein A2448_03475 [Candidatus Peregrinibacteria bacterium RIFOXYC2_FULL_41_22]
MYFIATFVTYLTQILIFLLIARVVLSWFRPAESSWINRFLTESTEPMIRIARKITPKTGMLDFAPLIAVVGLDLLRSGILYLLSNL